MKATKSQCFTLIELLVSIAVISVLVALLATVAVKCVRYSKKTSDRIALEHYRKHLPYVDEKPIFVSDSNIAYFTNYAFPGVLFSVQLNAAGQPMY